MLDRGLDAGAVFGDRAGEGDEGFELAAARPLKPGVQQRAGVLGRDAVDRAQLFFE